jgi:hypothetical protein
MRRNDISACLYTNFRCALGAFIILRSSEVLTELIFLTIFSNQLINQNGFLSIFYIQICLLLIPTIILNMDKKSVVKINKKKILKYSPY